MFGASGVTAVTDKDLTGPGRDLGNRPVFEIDEARPEEEEEQDERDHHVVMEAAALIGPEEVAAEEAH